MTTAPTFSDAILDTTPVDEGLLDFIEEFSHSLMRWQQEFIEKVRHQQRPMSPKQIATFDQILASCLRAERSSP